MQCSYSAIPSPENALKLKWPESAAIADKTGRQVVRQMWILIC